MFIFSVKDMEACDSAVAIVKSVLHVDEDATVFVSMARHGVEITTESAGAAQMSDAISDAGFTPVLLPSGMKLPGLGRTPQSIPFSGADHDFSPTTRHSLPPELAWP